MSVLNDINPDDLILCDFHVIPDAPLSFQIARFVAITWDRIARDTEKKNVQLVEHGEFNNTGKDIFMQVCDALYLLAREQRWLDRD